MGKLKSALGAHQFNAKRKASESARAAAAAAKAASTKQSAASRRAIKRQRQEKDAGSAAPAAGKSAGTKGKLVGSDSSSAAPSMGTAQTTEPTADRSNGADPALTSGGRRPTIPFLPDDTVLLLGEANFSFARALVSRGHAGHLVCATAYDSESDTNAKYPDAAENASWLRSHGVRVAYGVDAGALERAHKVVGRGRRWSRVVFNFPHAGKGITDQDRNVRGNQEMLLRALRSVCGVLTEGAEERVGVEVGKGKGKGGKGVKTGKTGKVAKVAKGADSDDDEPPPDIDDDDNISYAHTAVPSTFHPPTRQGSFLITLLDQPPYSLWDVRGLATRPPPVCPGTRDKQPRYRVLRSFEFVPGVYPGYAHRRTIGWKEGLSKGDNEEIVGRQGRARTWEFVRRDEEEE